MKCILCDLHSNQIVAPRVGAWIEILLTVDEYREYRVAPRVGAWIEILSSCNVLSCIFVAPRVGAWIEIWNLSSYGRFTLSLPVWERGLK